MMISRLRWMDFAMISLVLLSGSVVNAGEAKKVPERSEIDTKYLWKTDAIFATKAEWEAEFAAVDKLIGEVGKFKGTLSNGPDNLLAAFKFADELGARLDRVYVYSALLSDQDTRVGETQGMKARSRSLAVKYGQASSWAMPELVAIPFEQLDSWMRENAELAVYRHYLDDLLRQKKYILSPREEELIVMTGENSSTGYITYGLLANADIQYPKIKDEQGNTIELSDPAFYVMRRSPDRWVRKGA